MIGEHTDYSDGFALPVALSMVAVAAVARRSDGMLRLRSCQRGTAVTELPVAALTPGTPDGWAAYPAGVVWALAEESATASDSGDVLAGGLDLLVDSEVPQGAGLSSSAALECAVAAAVADVHGLDLTRTALARLAQRAENRFVGMPCGLMDQLAALCCEAGHALFLDTRGPHLEQVPFDLADAGLALLVIDTRAPHRLVDGEYAARRRSCEQAAAALGVPALRDVADLDAALRRLADPTTRRRVHHVVTENARVRDAVALLWAGRPSALGPLLDASHRSLRDDYEVSVPQLDTAVAAAVDAGALGARMTGGGFGGCAVALVDQPAVPTVESAVRTAYARAGFAPPGFFTVTPGPGTVRIDPSQSG